MQHYIGKEVHVSLEPYHSGTARIDAIHPAHQHGKPEKLVAGYTTVEVTGIAMKQRSSLMGQSRVSDMPNGGGTFTLHIWTNSLPAMLERGSLRYSYGI